MGGLKGVWAVLHSEERENLVRVRSAGVAVAALVGFVGVEIDVQASGGLLLREVLLFSPRHQTVNQWRPGRTDASPDGFLARARARMVQG